MLRRAAIREQEDMCTRLPAAAPHCSYGTRSASRKIYAPPPCRFIVIRCDAASLRFDLNVLFILNILLLCRRQRAISRLRFQTRAQ